MSRRSAIVSAVVIGLLALALLGQLAVREVAGFGSGARAPRGSSYSTGPTGLSAYAALLRRAGHRVEQRHQPLDLDLPVDPADALVVLDAEKLAPEEGAAIRRFVAAGGRAVIGGTSPNGWLPEVLDDAPTWVPGGNSACHRIVAVPEARAVTDVVLTRSGYFSDQAGTLAFLACAGKISAAVASPGGPGNAGRIVLLSDSGPLQNQFLTARDDSALALGVVADRRTVVFAEQVHGYGASAGVFGLPDRGRAAVALMLLALLLAVAALRARPRSGGPLPVPLSAPRLELVEAVAARLQRAYPVRQRAKAIADAQATSDAARAFTRPES